MSAGVSVPLATAAKLAARVAAALGDVCERVEIVGSVRRRKPFCGDIDLLCIKRRGADLFGKPHGSPADDVLAKWAAAGRILPRRGCKPGWRHATFEAPAVPGLPIELYACEADNFGLWQAIRTGPPGLSRQLVTHRGVTTAEGEAGLVPGHLLAPAGGFRLLGSDGVPWPTPEEADVWRIYDLPDIPPEERCVYPVPEFARRSA